MLLGAALWRSGAVAPGVAAVVIASQPIHLVAAVILPGVALDVLAGWGLTAVGYALVSVAVLRTPDAEWDLPPLGCSTEVWAAASSGAGWIVANPSFDRTDGGPADDRGTVHFGPSTARATGGGQSTR